ncbi:hypothetical protein H0H93_004580 [Arthromyces matolae]|nr:hypothetical protein H0H93_004580 [Arthromyces matolae]
MSPDESHLISCLSLNCLSHLQSLVDLTHLGLFDETISPIAIPVYDPLVYIETPCFETIRSLYIGQAVTESFIRRLTWNPDENSSHHLPHLVEISGMYYHGTDGLVSRMIASRWKRHGKGREPARLAFAKLDCPLAVSSKANESTGSFAKDSCDQDEIALREMAEQGLEIQFFPDWEKRHLEIAYLTRRITFLLTPRGFLTTYYSVYLPPRSLSSTSRTMPIDVPSDLQTKLQARYGKDKIRVLRVVREGAWHHVVEYNVTVLVEGDIDTSYTQADNSVVVATDSIKNITYYLAKVSPHVLVPEHFALHLGTHIVSRYSHLHKAFITIEQLRWSRISTDSIRTPGNEDKGHTHAFLRDGDDKRVVQVEIDASTGKENLIARVSAGISDLLVLKSTGSAFTSFVRDEYTTLAEVDDRIFSTAVDLQYSFAAINLPAPTDEKKLEFQLGENVKGSVWDALGVANRTRDITLEVFANDDSASVQATLYKMAQLVLAQNTSVQSVTYALPNKHYIPVDMRYIGLENVQRRSFYAYFCTQVGRIPFNVYFSATDLIYLVDLLLQQSLESSKHPHVYPMLSIG